MPFHRRLWQAYLQRLQERPLTTKATCAAVIFFSSDTATQILERRRGSGADGRRHEEPRQERRPRLDGGDGNRSVLTRKAAVATADDHDRPVEFQFCRALSGAAFGVVATAWLHHWWNLLERIVATAPWVPLIVRRNRLATALAKVAVDQSVGAPMYIYAYYVLTNALGEILNVAPMSDSLNRGATVDWNRMTAVWKDATHKANERFWPTMLRHWQVWPAVHTANFYFVPLQHRVLVQNAVLVGWSGYLSHLNHGQNQGHSSQTHGLGEESSSSEAQSADLAGAVVLRRTSLALSLPHDEGLVVATAKGGTRQHPEAEVCVS